MHITISCNKAGQLGWLICQHCLIELHNTIIHIILTACPFNHVCGRITHDQLKSTQAYVQEGEFASYSARIMPLQYTAVFQKTGSWQNRMITIVTWEAPIEHQMVWPTQVHVSCGYFNYYIQCKDFSSHAASELTTLHKKLHDTVATCRQDIGHTILYSYIL